jgi:hypothetical protein
LRIKAPVSGTLLGYLVTSQPDIGRPINELKGMASRMVPSCASFSAKFILMVGILEAQVEKQKPDKKKNRLRNILYLTFASMNY